MTLGVGYEVVVRYLFRAPTPWAFDLSYMLYGTLFMMAGAYTLSRDGACARRLPLPAVAAAHPGRGRTGALLPVLLSRRDRRWSSPAGATPPAPGAIWKSAPCSPANIPIFQFKSVIVAAGILLFLQGIAQVFRCIICLRTGAWPRAADDVEETEKILMEAKTLDVLQAQLGSGRPAVRLRTAGNDRHGRSRQ